MLNLKIAGQVMRQQLLVINAYIALNETFKGAVWVSLCHVSF